jgi:UDP-N-acetylmuramoyl-L-alanyl-D-glutamate--2,6-diaminopimelate ligase
MKLNEIICDLPVKELIGDGDISVDYLSCRAEKIKQGTMFFCIRGYTIDGHVFAEKALADGAVALVVERQLNLTSPVTQIVVENVRAFMALAAKNFFDSASDKLKIIGVTGTNGKTSTTYILNAVLKQKGYKTGVIGTNGVFIDNIHFLTQLTTPDPIELHEWFYKMYLSNVDYVIMEASAHAIALDKLEGINFEVGVFTNFGQDHLDFFEDLKAYGEAKKRFFSPKYIKIAIVNADDKLGVELIAENKVPTLTYGIENPSDIFAIDIKEDEQGISYTVNLCEEVGQVSYALKGRFNVYNTLCASAVARALGINLTEITQGISNVTHIDGRNEVFTLKNGCRAVVDFAHTPEGFKNVLNYLKSTTQGKLLCVFGCGGERDKFKRPLIAKEVSRFCDYAVVTNDNPRYENPQSIIRDILDGMTIKYDVIEDRQTAIMLALNMASAFDTVAILGKGAERYQEISGRKYPFSDVEIVKKYID